MTAMDVLPWAGLVLSFLAAFVFSVFHVCLGSFLQDLAEPPPRGPGEGLSGEGPSRFRRDVPRRRVPEDAPHPRLPRLPLRPVPEGPLLAALVRPGRPRRLHGLSRRPAAAPELPGQGGRPAALPARLPPRPGPGDTRPGPVAAPRRPRGAARRARGGPRGLGRGDRDLHRRGDRGGHHRQGRGRAPAERRRVRRHRRPRDHDVPGQHGLHPQGRDHRQPQGPHHPREVLAHPRLQGPARQHRGRRHGQGPPRVRRREAQGPADRGPHPAGGLRPGVDARPRPPQGVPEDRSRSWPSSSTSTAASPAW